MKTFRVSLTKSYLVEINAESEERAKQLVEFFTSDITDLSTAENRKKDKFSIENIDCTVNQAFDAEETESKWTN